MRAHEIENGKIVNTIIVNSLSDRPNLVDADLYRGQKGDEWDGSQVVPVPEPEAKPLVLTKADLLASLLVEKKVITQEEADSLEGK